MINKSTKTYCLLAILLFAVCGMSLGQPAGYQYYKQITIQNSQVQGSHSNFPVLIDITDADLQSNTENANGYDIIFASDANGSNILNHQVENFDNSNGHLVAWVQIPNISGSSNTSIYMFYGNSSVSSNSSTEQTWDNNYVMVQHLNNSFQDGTSYGNGATNNGSSDVAGQIGRGRAFNGSSNYLTIADAPSLNMDNNNSVTVSGWVWKNAAQSGWRAIVQKSNQSYNLQFNTGTNQPTFTIHDGGWNNAIAPSNIPQNQWVYITGTFDGTNVRTYVDGSEVASSTAGTISSTSEDVGVAENLASNGRYLDGRLDELRISNTARSADWIATEYNNQSDPSSFYTLGSQQTIQTDDTPPGVPQNLSATAIANGSVSLSFDDLDETGSGVSSYSLQRSTTQGGPYSEIASISDDESSTYSYTDNSTSDGTTYYYVATAMDAAGNESNTSAEASVTTDGTAPSLESATIAGNTLTLDYDELLNANSVPDAAEYTVQINGSSQAISNVSISNETVILTLNTSVSGGDDIIISYTAGTNPIEDAAGNEAGNLSNQSVVNNSDNTPPSLETATVNANSLKLTYSEKLDNTTIPDQNDYNILVNGNSRSVTNVQINSDKVNLTLDPAVTSGDNVQINYTAGNNAVQDPAGNQAANLSGETASNNTFSNTGFGPDPCPINNGQDAAWACFDGASGGTSISAFVGSLEIASVDAAAGSQTTFAPNALQEWASGDFAGDEYNGPQANPSGSSGNATSFNITIPSDVPSNALILALNRLRPASGGTSYTLEAFDASNNKIAINDWQTGQGTDGGVCTNNVNLAYTNGNTTLEFRPTVSGDPSCASSSTPVWMRITDNNIQRIEIRKTTSQPDNIHFGLALTADFGDAPNTYNTRYNSRTTPPALHILNNNGNNSVYFGSGVDADGNGRPNASADGDNNDSGLGSGNDEDGIVNLPELTSNKSQYSVTLSCTNSGEVGGWIDFNQSNSFEFSEFASGTCSSGSVTLSWSDLSGLVTGQSYGRFRIASNAADVSEPAGTASDGEVEDYEINILPPPETDLEIAKSVDRATPVEGDNVTFTVEAINNGPDDATGVEITNQLPNGLTFISANAEQGSFNQNTGSWDVGNIAAQDTIALDITATVNSGTSGQTITNSASVSSYNENDPNLSNNTGSSGISVVTVSTDIAVSQSVDNNNPNEGEYVTFTITATNNGPRDATGLDIINQIPPGLSFESATPSSGSYDETSGIWTIGSLNDGNSATLTLQVRVDRGAEGQTITNTAAVDNVNQNDDTNSNNSSSVDVEIVPGGIPICGETPELTFTNPTLISGTQGQVGAVYLFEDVTTGVDAEVEIITNNNATLNNIDVPPTEAGADNNFQPQVEATNKNQDGYMDFEVRLVQSGNSNSVFISLAASAVDVDGDGSANREYVGFQRLTSFIVGNTTNLSVGSAGIYTTFTPGSAANVSGIDVTNTENLVYTTYTNEPQFRIRTGVQNPQDNGAAPRYFSFNFDPCNKNLFPNGGTSTNIVDVGVTKSVDNNNPNTGDTINYTITAENKQDNTVNNIEVTDQLPNGLTFDSYSSSQGSFSNNSGIWDVGNLSGNESATLTISASVNNNTEGDVITNTASYSSYDGQDGNTNNNSASVSLSVVDPNISGCTEPPYFSFDNNSYTLQEGSGGQVGAVYRFTNVRSGIDALVEITDIQNATLNNVDSNLGNSTANFSPLFTATSSNGYIDWKISFVEAGTSEPVKQDFALSALDIDGSSSNGGTIKDYYGFAQNQASIIQGTNNIERTAGNPFEQFISSDNQDGDGSFDPSRIAYIVYRYTSVLNIRTGSETTGGYQDDRLVDIDFRQCINDEFSSQTQTTRDADISVSKTTDNANPLTGETVNFTVTATNNGGANGVTATEVDVEDTLPEGLTLVNKNPSQGTYNQSTNIWTVGTLGVGSSATLNLETTVDQDAPQNLVNKAFVKGLNQFDGNVSNDTSEVSLQISTPINGTVFEDKTGDALADGDTEFGDATGDQQAKANVKVHLFKDGGDGAPDGNDDSYLRSTTTKNTGEYQFQVGEGATYWIAVDSRSGGFSNGTSWAQQTYAPSGATCTNGSGGSAELSSAGNCFGGRRAGVSDAIPQNPSGNDLANAEHLAKVTMSGSEITDINFGFSYNVVTNVSDGDDDGNASRSKQGSLRQFIQNANTISGANTMRFVPVVPANASGSWWNLTLSSALPAITDALTTLNGTAYDLNNPTAERGLHTGTVGTGGSVGTENGSVPSFAVKDFEIDLNDSGGQSLNINSSGAVVIRNVALYNNANTIHVAQTSSGIIENNFLGARADGSNPSGGLRAQRGIRFAGSSSSSTLVQQNYVAFSTNSGIQSANPNASIQLFKNEITQNGLSNNQGDGISGAGTWTIEQNLIHQNGNANSQSSNGGSGIELGGNASSQNNTIRNNTIRNNSVSGITTLNSVSSTLIEKNVITSNGTNYSGSSQLGPGIKLATPNSQSQQGIKISRNTFYGNQGLSIDAVESVGAQADGVNVNDGSKQSASSVPNRGVDYPVFTLATLENGNLHVEGYVGTFNSNLSGPFTIEIYKADDDGDNDGQIETGNSLVRPHGEGRYYIGTITTNADGTFSEDITVGGSVSLVINDRITATATGGANNTSEFGSNQRVVPTGVKVSGHVFNDDNHNQVRESGESGLESVTVVLYNEQENNCRSVLTNQDGYYEFNNVLNGDYTLIEAYGQSIPTPDVCTPTPTDPDSYVSTTGNALPLVVNNQPATKDFGDYKGIKVQGTVFNDNGVSGGTANDANQNGGESGIAGTVIKALTGGGTLIEQTNTSGDGNFTLYFPSSSAPNGSNVIVKEVNKGNFITIGGSAGSTNGSYSKANDEIGFTVSAGTAYSSVRFADVPQSRLLTDGQKNLLPGSSGLFQHTFEAKTAGTVTFSTQSSNNPSEASWNILLYRDSNGNGAIDSGEPQLNSNNPVSVSANETLKLLLKVTVPLGVNDGANSQTDITATFNFSNTSPVITNTLTRTDLVQVNESNGGLEITKTVDKSEALPGSVLTYTIDYVNNGDEPISTLEIVDDIPAFTTYQNANCNTLPNNLTDCTINPPSTGNSGTISWTFDGTLQPGASGTVTYQVKIEE